MFRFGVGFRVYGQGGLFQRFVREPHIAPSTLLGRARKLACV